MANDKIRQINKNTGSMADKLVSFEGKCNKDERDLLIKFTVLN